MTLPIRNDDGTVTDIAIDPAQYTGMLVVQTHGLRQQIEAHPTLVAHWRTLAGIARYEWQRAERDYRVWRSDRELHVARNGIEGLDKKPTVAAAEAWVRTLPEYVVHQNAIERAEARYSRLEAIVAGLNELGQALRADNNDARRRNE